jgi:hypothetical protein
MDRASLIERIADTLAGAARHPLGVAGLMIQDEIKAGRAVMQPGSVWPFEFIEADWHFPAVVSHDGREVRIVAILALHPGNGAFRRLVDNITGAGLAPVVVEPVGVVMPAIMKRWKWRGSTRGVGENTVNEWRPPARPCLTDGAPLRVKIGKRVTNRSQQSGPKP